MDAYGRQTEAWTDEAMIWSKSSHIAWRSWGLALVLAVDHGWYLSWVIGPWHGHLAYVEPLT